MELAVTSSPTVALESEAKPAFKPGLRFYLAFGSLLIITLAAALDATSLSVALPIISQRLHGTAIKAFWCGTSFLLASTVFQPTFASLSHTFGRKPMLLLALVFFTAGAIAAALATNFTALLVGRTIQGIGGGGIISLVEVLITDLVPLRERGVWFGYQSGVWALGSVTGPIIGGIFAQNVTWRWIFWINLPFCAIGFVAIVLFLHLNKRLGSIYSKLLVFDWIGAIVLTASATSFLMAISWGGVMYSWSSWQTILPLLLGVFGIIGFICLESYLAREPLIRFAIFKQRTAMVNYFGTFIHGVVLWCLLYYLPLYYEGVKDYTPTIVGVAVFPETFTVAPASVIVGVAISITGRFRWAIWSGWFLTVLGMGVLCRLSPNTSIPAWIFMNLVPGLGLGMLYSSLGYAIQASAEQVDVAFAAAMYTFSRSFGQSIGVAIGGAIFQTQFKAKLTAYPALAGNATELAQDSSTLVQIIKAMPKDLPEREMLVTAYADSLKVLWAVMAGLAFVAFVLSCGTEGLNLDEQHVTEQGLKEKKPRPTEKTTP
ncbi:MAG: hypothetical protein LQ347_003249 [Umbilicaria vellea]|nr:MAG: hypothetical protein LQ347_003249 [Umbilicaria vellea]